MNPPTFVASYSTGFDAVASPRTSSVTVTNGDVLGVLSGSEDNNFQLSTPTGGGLTYSPQQTVQVANFCTAYIWTALPASNQSFTFSQAIGAGGSAGFGSVPMRFSGSNGVGASSSTNASGAPSLNISTTSDNSAVLVIVTDWNASDGTSRTWRTVNSITPSNGNGYERVYFTDSSRYTIFAAYYPNVGTAGSKTVGLSAPSSQKYSIAAIEIKGAPSAAGVATAWLRA